MAELLSTILFVAVLVGIQIGIRAVAVTNRNGLAFELTPRRLSSSLAISLFCGAYIRMMMVNDSFSPSAGAVAASHLANLAFLGALGWWLWSLYADGVLVFGHRGSDTRTEGTGADTRFESWSE